MNFCWKKLGKKLVQSNFKLEKWRWILNQWWRTLEPKDSRQSPTTLLPKQKPIETMTTPILKENENLLWSTTVCLDIFWALARIVLYIGPCSDIINIYQKSQQKDRFSLVITAFTHSYWLFLWHDSFNYTYNNNLITCFWQHFYSILLLLKVNILLNISLLTNTWHTLQSFKLDL